MKVSSTRPHVFTVTATSHELSALVAAGRLALDVMARDPAAPREAVDLLTRVLRDYDDALERLQKSGGRFTRPPEGSPDAE